jgi:hypothetical protein
MCRLLRADEVVHRRHYGKLPEVIALGAPVDSTSSLTSIMGTST